jgi:hypothetical protein
MAVTIRAAFEDAGMGPRSPMPQGSDEAGPTPPRPRLTRHAVERHTERLRPALEDVIARQELHMPIGRATVLGRPPSWIGKHAISPFYAVPLGKDPRPVELDRIREVDLGQVSVFDLTRARKDERRVRAREVGRSGDGSRNGRRGPFARRSSRSREDARG